MIIIYYCRLFGVQFSPTVLADIINSQLSWQLAISRYVHQHSDIAFAALIMKNCCLLFYSDGKQLAIARDDCIELRYVSIHIHVHVL